MSKSPAKKALSVAVTVGLMSKDKPPARAREIITLLLKHGGIFSGNFRYHITSIKKRGQQEWGEEVVVQNVVRELRLTIATASKVYSGKFAEAKGTQTEDFEVKAKRGSIALSRILAQGVSTKSSGEVSSSETTGNAGDMRSKYTPQIAKIPEKSTVEVHSKWYDIVCKLERLKREFAELKMTYLKGTSPTDVRCTEIWEIANRRGGVWKEFHLRYHAIRNGELEIITSAIRGIDEHIAEFTPTLSKMEKLSLIKLGLSG